jgi:hypothetical protein
LPTPTPFRGSLLSPRIESEQSSPQLKTTSLLFICQ